MLQDVSPTRAGNSARSRREAFYIGNRKCEGKHDRCREIDRSRLLRGRNGLQTARNKRTNRKSHVKAGSTDCIWIAGPSKRLKEWLLK
jgi:hypothetical protein